MKLLNCRVCHDILRLLEEKERTCECGRSRGRLKTGAVLAVYAGPARILGMNSRDYFRAEQPGEEYPWFIVKDGNHVKKEDTP